MFGNKAFKSTSSSMHSVRSRCKLVTRALPLWSATLKAGRVWSPPQGKSAVIWLRARIFSGVPLHVTNGSELETKPSVRKLSNNSKQVDALVGSLGEDDGSKLMHAMWVVLCKPSEGTCTPKWYCFVSSTGSSCINFFMYTMRLSADSYLCIR